MSPAGELLEMGHRLAWAVARWVVRLIARGAVSRGRGGAMPAPPPIDLGEPEEGFRLTESHRAQMQRKCDAWPQPAPVHRR